MSSDSDFQERGVANGRLTFAFKLWEVANDGKLITWNSTGDGVIVDKREYEDRVRQIYPKFAQNSSFLNLRRLFRDYGFKSKVLYRKRPHGVRIEFVNPLFKKDDYENLINVIAKDREYKYKSKSSGGSVVYKARRKYTRRYPTYRSVLGSSGITSRIPTRSRSFSNCLPCPPRKRGRPPNRLRTLTSSSSANSSFSDMGEGLSPRSDKDNKLSEDDMFRLFQIFAKNELSEETYVEAALKRVGHRFEHLKNGSFEDIAFALDGTMDPGLSPFCCSGATYEYSLDEM